MFSVTCKLGFSLRLCGEAPNYLTFLKRYSLYYARAAKTPEIDDLLFPDHVKESNLLMQGYVHPSKPLYTLGNATNHYDIPFQETSRTDNAPQVKVPNEEF